MSNACIVTEARTGGGDTAAPRLALWLGLAAAPTFAIMGLWTALFSGQQDALCMGTPHASPLNEMTLMYVLMSAFHAGPWLKRIARTKPGGEIESGGPARRYEPIPPGLPRLVPFGRSRPMVPTAGLEPARPLRDYGF